MNHRIREFCRSLLRPILVGLGMAVLLIGWRAFLHYGPRMAGENKPAMFRFHAYLLVRQWVSFPQLVPETVLPTPQSMSSADVQLRLMNWRDGSNWLPPALVHGEARRGGLRFRAGKLALVEVAGMELVRTKDFQTICRVTCKVRWDFPEDLQELLRVKEIIELRLPDKVEPGQSAEVVCSFVRRDWRWEFLSVEAPWGGRLDSATQHRTWVDWLL